MWGVAQEAKKHFGDAIEVVEYRYNTIENIARIKKWTWHSFPAFISTGN